MTKDYEQGPCTVCTLSYTDKLKPAHVEIPGILLIFVNNILKA